MLELKDAPSKIYIFERIRLQYIGDTCMVRAHGGDVDKSVIAHVPSPKKAGANPKSIYWDYATNISEAENLAFSILCDCFGDQDGSLAYELYEEFASYLMAVGHSGFRITAHQIYQWINDIEALEIPELLYDAQGNEYQIRLSVENEKSVYVVAGKKEKALAGTGIPA